jgi:hypothetical protein
LPDHRRYDLNRALPDQKLQAGDIMSLDQVATTMVTSAIFAAWVLGEPDANWSICSP